MIARLFNRIVGWFSPPKIRYAVSHRRHGWLSFSPMGWGYEVRFAAAEWFETRDEAALALYAMGERVDRDVHLMEISADVAAGGYKLTEVSW